MVNCCMSPARYFREENEAVLQAFIARTPRGSIAAVA